MDKFIVSMIVFNAVLFFLPLIGINNGATNQPIDVYNTTTQIINPSTGAPAVTNLGSYLGDIVKAGAITTIISALLLKFILNTSGGLILAYSIFFGVFATLGLNAIRVFVNLIGAVGDVVPGATAIMTGIFGICSLIFFYKLIIYVKNMAVGV